MPRRPSETLTDAELRIMNVLWLKGSGTVQSILDALPATPSLAYNSVLTTIRILERKGYVVHVKDGRAHVYAALVGQKEARRSEIRHLVGRFFKNSQDQLVLNILEERGMDAAELDRLRAMLVQGELVQGENDQGQSDRSESDGGGDKIPANETSANHRSNAK